MINCENFVIKQIALCVLRVFHIKWDPPVTKRINGLFSIRKIFQLQSYLVSTCSYSFLKVFFPFFAFSHPTRLRVKTFQNTSTNTQGSAVSEVLIMFRSRPVSQCYLHLKVHAHFQSCYVVKLQFHSDSKNPKHTPPKTNKQNNWYGMIIRKISWNAWTKGTIETAPSSPASMKQHQFTTASTTFFLHTCLFLI